MKKLLIVLKIFFGSYLAFSQNTNYAKAELPLFKLENKEFTTVIDSIVSFSEKCEGSGLKFLNFTLGVRELEPNVYQIHLTLIDCQGLNFLLTSKNRNMATGYFVHKNRTFIITGSLDLAEIFKPTDSKKMFESYSSKNLFNKDYSTWDYMYNAIDNKFKKTSFNPICVSEEDRIFPLCSDSMKIKKQ